MVEADYGLHCLHRRIQLLQAGLRLSFTDPELFCEELKLIEPTNVPALDFVLSHAFQILVVKNS